MLVHFYIKFLRIIACCLLFPSIALQAQMQLFPHPERINYDKHCLRIEGKDVFIYSGAFHYFRVPRPLWKDRFEKMKAAGFNSVETYIPWNWHEQQMPASPEDFSKIDLREFTDWMDMAVALGFYVIVRPGPYICAEWDGGGFPRWLLKKRPAVIRHSAWLQSDDPDFLAWNRHWYKAVCNAVVPYQITKKKPGEPGVILFQIENEYERVNWFADSMKRVYLEKLATFTREYGMEVPIFTCWTTQSRNVKEGSLAGMVDFVNVYPRWDISKRFGGIIDKQIKDQPDAPLMSAELQGGWYAEVTGKPSRKQDGVAPVQTQNITLYAIQRGFSLINFYMLVGGTNFDDWASRETATSYDFAAAIAEDGSVGEKYRRLKAIGDMLREHGTRLARSEPVEVEITKDDSLVEVALRRSIDGSRYIFLRTEARDKKRTGKLEVREKNGQSFSIDYELEPFGSKVLFLPDTESDASKGTWYPRLSGINGSVSFKTGSTLQFSQVWYKPDFLPEQWKHLKPGLYPDDDSVYNRHFIYYKTHIPAGSRFSVGRIGDKVVNNSRADEVLTKVGENILSPLASDKDSVTYQMPERANEVVLLFENRGLHHHTKKIVEDNWSNGIKWIKVNGKEIPVSFASVEKQRGQLFTSLSFTKSGWKRFDTGTLQKNELLNWYKIEFETPKEGKHTPLPLHLRIFARGNGFLYFNGKCIGRYWQNGSQHDYYLPECWLRSDKKIKNEIAIVLRPTDGATSVEQVALVTGNAND